MRRKTFIQSLAIGVLIAIISNLFSLELIFDLIATDIIKKGELWNYSGRLALSFFVTLWMSILVAFFISQKAKQKASKNGQIQTKLLTTNKDTNLPNAQWLDNILVSKIDPISNKKLEIQSFQLHIVMWWNKFNSYLSNNDKQRLFQFIKSHHLNIENDPGIFGYLGNGIFYSINSDRQFNTSFESLWDDYSVVIRSLAYDPNILDNSYKLAHAANAISEKYELGFDYKSNFRAFNSHEGPNSVAWRAILKQDIDFEFQPFFELKSEKIVGLEMLARVKDEMGVSLGLNDQVIDLIENSPLSIGFLAYFFERLLSFQNNANEILTGLVVSINIPAPIVMRSNFIPTLEYYQSLGLSIKGIAFELTERSLPSNSEELKLNLDWLNKNGANIYLDDFGAGQSSIEKLSNYNFQVVKFDRKFVNDGSWSPNRANALIAYCKTLGVEVLVEGIEDKNLSRLFADAGAKYVQGFAYSRPLKKVDALSFLKA